MRIELNRKVPQTNQLSLGVLDMDDYFSHYTEIQIVVAFSSVLTQDRRTDLQRMSLTLFLFLYYVLKDRLHVAIYLFS